MTDRRVTVATGNKRLLELASFLCTLKKEQFDYSTFGKEAACGTVACALGWAVLSMDFSKKAGISLEEESFNNWKTANLQFVKNEVRANYREVSFALFGLSPEATDFLFIPGAIIPGAGARAGASSGLTKRASALAVAKHIRRFVKIRSM